MNDRIKELAEQVYGSAHHDDFKFAELVVLECARTAVAVPCPYTDPEQIKMFGHTWDMASIEAGRAIVRHFGI